MAPLPNYFWKMKSLAGFFSNLTPLFAALIWALWTGETPQLYHALAFLLIAGGIVVSSRR